jgi:hypothetical protein
MTVVIAGFAKPDELVQDSIRQNLHTARLMQVPCLNRLAIVVMSCPHLDRVSFYDE